MKKRTLIAVGLLIGAIPFAYSGWCTVCSGDECIQYMSSSPISWQYCGTWDDRADLNCEQWEKCYWQCKAGAWKWKFRFTTHTYHWCATSDTLCTPF